MRRSISGVSLILTALIFAYAPLAVAQERSYFYANIDTTIEVTRDASILVKERQTYDFTGEYHQGYRFIPHEKISGITDVVVFDHDGTPLQYSSSALDKTDPDSWGKYTYYYENGGTVIEWYYDLANHEHDERSWTIRYRAHGAVSFYRDHDEIYWNLFTDYDVPVGSVSARVITPSAVQNPQTSMYIEPVQPQKIEAVNDHEFLFSTSDIPPQGKVTIALGWQKGLVSQAAFWKDWMTLNAGLIIAILILISATIFGILHWFFVEVYHKGRGTIIPEYEPPRHLPPAMGQLIATERISDATWPATLVDLAVRGYVRIVKEKRSWETGFAPLDWLSSKEGYRVERLKDYTNDPHLQNFEREFLDLLFAERATIFSTIDLKRKLENNSMERVLFQQKMKDLEKTLYEETTKDTNAYEIPLTVKSELPSFKSVSGTRYVHYAIWLVVALVVLADLIPASFLQYALVIGSALIASIGLYIGINMNPRLSPEGFLLRDDWRGFKLYLKTAEKDRVQKLTPDLFEKFLPYAMIFKIEKDWARAFDAMNLKQPNWYSSGGMPATFVSSGSSDVAGGFSPSVFSASFSSSFTSAFSSSGAGGASGGGGGAGGGGGGGGGGAS